MIYFSGTEYLKIDIANCYGLDKETWNNRISWVNQFEPVLETMDGSADSPILYRKAVRAFRKVQQNLPTNHVMGLDATASGIQIMGALSGCENTCRATNLINTGDREDIYDAIAQYMCNIGHKVTRSEVKKPVMTVFYGSTAQPKNLFGAGTKKLDAFYEALTEKCTGAYNLMGVLQQYWNPNKTYHTWKLPDGHIASVPVTVTKERSLEIDEFNHLRFAYRATLLHPKYKSRSLAANIVHSIDAWVVRMMCRAARKQGFWLAPIHDCFYTSPNYMNQVRENYMVIMRYIARNNLVRDILSDLENRTVPYCKRHSNISPLMKDAEYALS